MILRSCILFLIISITSITNFVNANKVYQSDLGNGYYKNPILHADYSDPDVVCVGDDYYMTASSFNCIPGIPILHSKDLVNWNLVNYALKEQVPVDFYKKPQHGKGVWAPCIKYNDGIYYIFWGDPDFGIYMINTKDPLGEWSEPYLVKSGKGMIDPSPLWDEDGKAYLAFAWAASRSGINSIIVVNQMSIDGKSLIGNPIMVFDGNEGANHTVEGPKLYKKGEYYYIFAPAGGVTNGWQLAMRSKNIYGPYESKVVMAQGETMINGPHQGAWIKTAFGEHWFIHFQDKGAYGRIIHLNPLKWVNDWPVIGNDKRGDGCGEPVEKYKKPKAGLNIPITSPLCSDEFNNAEIGKQWNWHANYNPTFGFPSNMGFMRLYSFRDSIINLWDVPSLFLQKFMAEEFSATTKIRFASKSEGEKAGLLIMGWDYSYLALERRGDFFNLIFSECKEAEQKSLEKTEVILKDIKGRYMEGGLYPSLNLDIWLKARIKKGAICEYHYSLDGKNYKKLSTEFKARQGKWIGAKIGLFITNPNIKGDNGWLDCDWFRISP